MELPTYTSIWQLERRLYKLHDWVLPVPVSLPAAAVFAVAAALWGLLLSAVGVPTELRFGWLYLLPPGFAAWAAARPVAEAKRPHELVASAVRFLLEPAVLCRLSEPRGPARAVLRAVVWTGGPR